MPLGRADGVTIEAAHTIVARALAHARDSDFPPMTVAALDAGGQLVAFAHGRRRRSLRAARHRRRGAAGRPRSLIQPSRL